MGSHRMNGRRNATTGEDPADINNGSDFIFLQTDANEKMRRNKRKVKYIFEGEEQEDYKAVLAADADQSEIVVQANAAAAAASQMQPNLLSGRFSCGV